MTPSTRRRRLGLLGLLWLLMGCAETELARGNRYYLAGDYDRAAESYRSALERGDRSPTLLYNYGTTLLRLERYDEARRILDLAAGGGEAEVRHRGAYNAGNTDLVPVFRGRPSESSQAAQLERAIEAYKRALLLQPPDMDAKWNLELAQRLLEREPRSGGGAADSPSGGGGGGGGGESPARARPAPGTAQPDGTAPPAPMTRTEADRLFAQAQQSERAVQREVLRRGQSPPPDVRAW